MIKFTPKTRKIVLISTGVVITGTIVALLINRSNKQKEIAKLNDILDSHVNEDGTSSNAFSPTYHNGKTTTLTKAQADDYAQTIYDSLGYLQIDKDDNVISVFSRLTSIADASMVADSFATKFNKDLKSFLSHLSSDSYSRVMKIIDALK